MRTVKLTKESTKDILENLLKRSPNNYGKFESTVAQILDKVKNEGDAALFAYTKEFDKADVTKETIRVTDAEIEEAYAQIDPALLGVIRKALVNIRQYHEKQIQNSWFTSTTDGTMLGQKVTPLNRVGVYVPGGKAVYPSSVLMNIVPAKVAGVPHIVMTTPPGKDGKVCASTLVAAKEAGADEIPDDLMYKAIEVGHNENQKIVAFIEEIAAKEGKEKPAYEEHVIRPRSRHYAGFWSQVHIT